MAIDKIDKVSKIGKKIVQETPVQEPNKDYFEALMRQRRVETEPVAKQEEAKKASSIFDEVEKMGQQNTHVTRNSPNDFIAQTEDVIAQIDTLKNKLETPDLEIKGGVQNILKNKLSDIDDNLKVAMNRAGLEYTPPVKENSLATPMERFLGLLSHSQNQLGTIASDIKTMAEMGNELSPANMLLIQMKVGQIQQEVELFTNLLNKALEATKTIMNVQV